MSQKAHRFPKYRHHKSTGRAVVTLGGREIYLGAYGTPESRGAYDRLIAEWIGAGRQLPNHAADLTILELVAQFWTHAQQNYTGGELDCYKQVLRLLKGLYGADPAASFGPIALKAVRQKMIDAGWARTHINRQCGRVRAIFRWAVADELIPPAVHQALQAVPGLRQGKTNARESNPVGTVPQLMIDAVLPLVSRQVGAMIQLQLLTGTRAGEFCRLRTADLDMAGTVWIYRPAHHKTAHHGHTREIWIGPKAQDILRPFIKTDLQAHVFSPADAEAERHAEQRQARKTPVQPSQIERQQRSARRRQARAPGDCYTVAAYRRAIQRACDQAFPAPDHLARRRGESPMAHRARLTADQRGELKAWQRSHRWHPHQLRHNAGTLLRREYGIEVARLILGHRSAAVTEIYAEADRGKAVAIMERVG